jgi:hypothetical protein
VPSIRFGKHEETLCRTPALDQCLGLTQRVWLCQRRHLQPVKQGACGQLADLRGQLSMAIDAASSHRRFSDPSRLDSRIIDPIPGAESSTDEDFVKVSALFTMLAGRPTF